MAWNPWHDAHQRVHLSVGVALLPDETGGGLYARWPDGTAVVVVDERLSLTAQSEALTHELIHDERGGGCPCSEESPAGWRAVVAREEAKVARMAAERLVPLAELAEHVERVTGLDEAVTAARVAEEFDTTERAAQLALLELWRAKRREIDLRSGA